MRYMLAFCGKIHIVKLKKAFPYLYSNIERVYNILGKTTSFMRNINIYIIFKEIILPSSLRH